MHDALIVLTITTAIAAVGLTVLILTGRLASLTDQVRDARTAARYAVDDPDGIEEGTP